MKVYTFCKCCTQYGPNDGLFWSLNNLKQMQMWRRNVKAMIIVFQPEWHSAMAKALACHTCEKCFIQMFWTHIWQKDFKSSRKPRTSIGRLSCYTLHTMSTSWRWKKKGWKSSLWYLRELQNSEEKVPWVSNDYRIETLGTNRQSNPDRHPEYANMLPLSHCCCQTKALVKSV